MTYKNSENTSTKNNKRQATPLPKDPNIAVKDVISSIEVLKTLFKEENSFLANTDTKGFSDMQENKFLAAIHYEDLASQMIERKNDFKNADPALKERLIKMNEEFQSIKRNNLESLKRMQDGTRRLTNTIRKAALRASDSQNAKSYTPGGDKPQGRNKTIISTGINETA